MSTASFFLYSVLYFGLAAWLGALIGGLWMEDHNDKWFFLRAAGVAIFIGLGMATVAWVIQWLLS